MRPALRKHDMRHHQQAQSDKCCRAALAGSLRASDLDPKHLAGILVKAGNYTQKHLRDAALCDDKKPAPFWAVSTSKTFTKVPMPFCNEPGLRGKLARAIAWHQGLISAMLAAARVEPALAPLARAHVRGVRYGIARQVRRRAVAVRCVRQPQVHTIVWLPLAALCCAEHLFGTCAAWGRVRTCAGQHREQSAVCAQLWCRVTATTHAFARVQVQQYVERLAALCARAPPGAHKSLDVLGVSIDGLFRWLQAYCHLWMHGFEARARRQCGLVSAPCVTRCQPAQPRHDALPPG
jgi:hypothetical protein